MNSKSRMFGESTGAESVAPPGQGEHSSVASAAGNPTKNPLGIQRDTVFIIEEKERPALGLSIQYPSLGNDRNHYPLPHRSVNSYATGIR